MKPLKDWLRPCILTLGFNKHMVHLATIAGTTFFFRETFVFDKERYIERGWWIGCNIIPGHFGLYFDYIRKEYK